MLAHVKIITRSICFLFLVLIQHNVHSQFSNGWELINPLPTGRNLNKVEFVNESVGFIGTDENVYKTLNGGETWAEVEGLKGIRSIDFLNNTGYSVPAYSSWGNVMRTTDGGNTWSSANVLALGSYKNVQVFSETSVIITTSQQIAYTTNGGEDWSYRYLPFSGSSASFFREDFSGVIVTSGGKIFKTNDAGLSWETTFDESGSSSSGFNCVTFSTNLTGYAGSTDSNKLYKTTDGGDTWNPVDIDIFFEIFDIMFLNENLGFFCGEYGKFYKTIDGGMTWTAIGASLLFNNTSDLKSLYAFDENTIISVGNLGRILKTQDGGLNWNSNSKLFRTIRDLFFVNDNVGYALGHFDIYKTVNGGFDWQMVSENPNGTYAIPYHLVFVSENEGYLASSRTTKGYYRKTIDGGHTWTLLTHPNSSYEHIPFLGFINGETLFTSTSYTSTGNHLPAFRTYKLTNSGETWTEIYTHAIYNISFASEETIYGKTVESGVQRIVKSSDEGDNWEVVLELENQYLSALDFPGPDVGYVISRIDYSTTDLLKTTDGGSTWNTTPFPSNLLEYTFRQMVFVNDNNGFIMSDNGSVFQTSDGGETWNYLSGTYGGLKMLSHGSYLYVTGGNGMLWRRLLPVAVDVSEIDRAASDWNIYPNPTNSEVNFGFPNSLQNLEIKLSDALGRVIRKATQINMGNSLSWDVSNLTRGVYFITIENGDFIDTKKLVIN